MLGVHIFSQFPPWPPEVCCLRRFCLHEDKADRRRVWPHSIAFRYTVSFFEAPQKHSGWPYCVVMSRLSGKALRERIYKCCNQSEGRKEGREMEDERRHFQSRNLSLQSNWLSVRRPIVKSATRQTWGTRELHACALDQPLPKFHRAAGRRSLARQLWRTGQEAETGDDSKEIGSQGMTDPWNKCAKCASTGVGVDGPVVSCECERHTTGGTEATNDTARVISAKARKGYIHPDHLLIGVQLWHIL